MLIHNCFEPTVNKLYLPLILYQINGLHGNMKHITIYDYALDNYYELYLPIFL